MEPTKSIKAISAQKQNFSKYDPSGTDPNRYASVSNPKEADHYMHKRKKSIIPGLRVNVSTPERIAMIAAGSYLLYRVLKKNDKRKVLEGITAGTMLFRGISGYCPAYDAMSNSKILKGNEITISASLSVNKSVSEVYNTWRQLENLPQFLKHIHSVNAINDHISEWKANIPGGIGTVSWKAEILMDEPNQLLTWHSIPGSTINNSGKVRFYGNGNSTNVDITISYHAPLGAPGEAAARLLTPVFEKMLEKDIQGFKEYIEGINIGQA